jgi:hypothetical protein
MTEETLVHEALAKPAAELAAFLDQACAGQPELRAVVEALLAAHSRKAFQGLAASKPTLSSRPSASVSTSILGPQMASILIPLTPSTGQDLTPGDGQRFHTGTKRARIALQV